jgi:hypothetical protein
VPWTVERNNFINITSKWWWESYGQQNPKHNEPTKFYKGYQLKSIGTSDFIETYCDKATTRRRKKETNNHASVQRPIKDGLQRRCLNTLT